MAKLMRIPVTLNKLGDVEIPKPKSTVHVDVPVPDSLTTGDDSCGADCVKLWAAYKDWGKSGKLSKAPKLARVIAEGLKVIARQEGVARIRESVGKGSGIATGVTFEKLSSHDE